MVQPPEAQQCGCDLLVDGDQSRDQRRVVERTVRGEDLHGAEPLGRGGGEQVEHQVYGRTARRHVVLQVGVELLVPPVHVGAQGYEDGVEFRLGQVVTVSKPRPPGVVRSNLVPFGNSRRHPAPGHERLGHGGIQRTFDLLLAQIESAVTVARGLRPVPLLSPFDP